MDNDLKQYLDASFRQLGERMDARFVVIDGRFTEMDGKFSSLDVKFAEIDGKLAALDGKFTGLDGKFTALDGKFTALDGKFAALDGKFATKRDLEAMEERVNSRIEKIETALLTEFHKWASPAEARARTHAAALRAIDLEMESLTERVSKLEKKKAS